MATTPMRPILPPEEVPNPIAPDQFFHRGLEDFSKARPKNRGSEGHPPRHEDQPACPSDPVAGDPGVDYPWGA